MRRFCYVLIVALLMSMVVAIPAQAADPVSCKNTGEHHKDCIQHNKRTMALNVVGYLAG